MKVLFITNIPSPYRVDFFNELGKHCCLTVAFERMHAKDRDKRWKPEMFINFKSVFLKGIELGTDASFCLQVISVIRQGYDIIVLGGYSSPTYGIAMEYMRAKGIHFILNADGGFIKEDRKMVYWLKRHLISRPSAWLSTGGMTDQYLEHYGADLNRTFRYPFSSVKEKECYLPSIEERENKKRLLEMEEQIVIITVGQFIYRKGLDLLIRCSEKLCPDTGVYIIGGEADDSYYKLMEELNIKRVHFVGFKSREELRNYYIAADLFVFPTREDIWGLVLNEAMSYGLPCVASSRAISSNELVDPGRNGYLIEPENVDEMADKLNHLSASRKERIRMGEAAFMKAQEYTIEKMAQRHMEIFKELIETGKS